MVEVILIVFSVFCAWDINKQKEVSYYNELLSEQKQDCKTFVNNDNDSVLKVKYWSDTNIIREIVYTKIGGKNEN